MKGRYWLVIVLSLATTRVVAQQRTLETSAPASDSAAFRAGVSEVVSGEAPSTGSNAIVKKRITASGPLVQPFRTKRLRDFPKHLLHLVNPFAPTEPRSEYRNTAGLSTRAWTTTAGWSPGRSAFPDAVTHEPTMNLISFGRTQ